MTSCVLGAGLEVHCLLKEEIASTHCVCCRQVAHILLSDGRRHADGEDDDAVVLEVLCVWERASNRKT